MAECRFLRALAMEAHLDPDRTLPEDILLLERREDNDRRGGTHLAAEDEYRRTRARAEREAKLAAAAQEA